MITHQTPYFHTANITFECLTPLTIKSEEADPTLDNQILRDAIGNPIILGTSIAGVLNHLYQDEYGKNTLFGSSDQHASYVKVGFAYLHNQHNQPQKGSVSQAANKQQDAILCYLQNQTPLLRDQVKINQYGSATDGAKADKTALPKGTRFSFELSLSSKQQNQEEWQNLLNLLNHPKFRLGGLTHRGFGKIKIISCIENQFDFTKDGLKQWQNYQQGNALNTANTKLKAQNYIKLKLTAEDFWRVGEGNTPIGKNHNKTPNQLPYSENTLQWQNNQGSIKQELTIVIPATAIKGALRHRTLYHLRCAKQDYLGDKITETDVNICQLFGDSAENGNGTGAIIIDDIYLEQHSTPKVMMHNKIDRFTGGTIKGALFSEELLYQDQIECPFYFDLKKLNDIEKDTQQAFINAIKDLAQGRLAIGAGSSKGHGYFSAQNLSEIIKHVEQQCKKGESPC